MGADTFIELCSYENNETIKATFDKAVMNAGFENGSGGYTGTIAEKGSFIKVSDKSMWVDEAMAFAKKLINQGDPRIADKWGPAGAIPVCRPYRTIEIMVSGYPNSNWDEVVSKELHLKKGETLIGWNSMMSATSTNSIKSSSSVSKKVLAKVSLPEYGIKETETVNVQVRGHFDSNRDLYTELERAAKNKVAKRSGVTVLKTNLIEKEQKAKVVTTVGTKRSTRYVIGVNGTKGEFEKGFDTLAKAKAKAKELAAEPMGLSDSSPKTYDIEAIVRSGDGSKLFTVSQEVISTSATVEVTFIKGRKEAPETNAWLFFGWASS